MPVADDGTGAPISGRNAGSGAAENVGRLLSNRRLQEARGVLYGAALQWLWPRCQTVIVVDWCVLKADKSLHLLHLLHLLRAALPVGGRALPV